MKIEIEENPREAWKTLRRAIPDRAAKAVAFRLNVSADHVRRWRREPLSDDAPLSSGQRSPVDRVCDLLDAVFLVSPSGAAYIVDHVAAHHQSLLQASLDPEHWDKRADTADLLRETIDAVNALNLDAPDEETITELVEAKTAIDQVLTRIQKSRRSSLGAGTGGQEQSESARNVGSRADSRGGQA